VTTTDLISTRRDSTSTMTRRSAFKVFAGAGAALVAAAVAGPAVLANHTAQLYTVSSNANFRTGPGTGYAIITVIATGATFTLNGQSQNGYAGITYQGRTGWVLASLVVAAGSTPTDPVISGVAYTTAAVNLRSGPSTSNAILRVVPKDAKIGTSTTERNGFLYVSHSGLVGWMSTAFIAYRDAPSDDQGGNYKTATVALNLRAEPSTSAKILTVIPAGAKVQLLHTQVGQFGNVNYGGYQGWAALAYLK
jgi:zinc D-Ala-D-Ala carboxypeptidase